MALIVFSTELTSILLRPLKVSFVSSRDKISEGFEWLNTRAIQVFSPTRSSTAKGSVTSWWPIAILAFPGYACVAYAVVVHKSYKGTVDYAVAPQIMAATNAIRSAWKFTVFIVSKPKRHGLDSY